jgi:tripartite-type tricarboxylate transporter receptor subunit TctC
MLRLVIVAAVALLAATSASAEPFYAGKTITIVTSTGPGGSYDLVARMVAAHMPSHIPGNPTMTVENMPGAGHVLATNYMYNLAPKDGTVIATVDNIIPLHQVIDGRGVRYDAGKFNWIGSTGPDNSVAFVWSAAGIKTIDDARKRDVILGATGAGSSTIVYATIMNNLLGTRFKIVTGYRSSAEVFLAMQRGELESSTGSFASIQTGYRDWLTEKKVAFIAQMGLKRNKDLADVPLLTELARTDEQREIMKLNSSPLALGEVYLAPPGLPPDRVRLLRDAYAATLRDPAFLADAAKAHFSIDPMSGDAVSKIVDDTVHTPPGIVEKAKIAMTPAKETR